MLRRRLMCDGGGAIDHTKLTFTCPEGNAVFFTYSDIGILKFEYSRDNVEWFTFNYKESYSIDAQNPLYLRGRNKSGITRDRSDFFYFSMSGSPVYCSGSIMSLIDYNEPKDTIPCDCCFSWLFYDCKNLVTAPALPATTLTNYCYYNMFLGCTSLIEAPALPATTLTDYCYYGMFSGCTSLIEAPALPATTLTDSCYDSMFLGCSNLEYVKIYATSKGRNSTSLWLHRVSPTGIIECPEILSLTADTSGVPSGWTRVNI